MTQIYVKLDFPTFWVVFEYCGQNVQNIGHIGKCAKERQKQHVEQQQQQQQQKCQDYSILSKIWDWTVLHLRMW